METLLERTRRLHQTLEEKEQQATCILLEPTSAKHRDSLLARTKVAHLLNEMSLISSDLIELYEDKDDFFKQDLAKITGVGEEWQDCFYSRLKDIKDHYRPLANELEVTFDPAKHANTEKDMRDTDHFELEILELDKKFTGEEGLGKYFDLHTIYTSLFLNMKSKDKKKDEIRQADLTYLVFLEQFDDFARWEAAGLRECDDYYFYLQSLANYFADWTSRAQPLFDITAHHTATTISFNAHWAAGTLPLWPKPSLAAIDPSLYCLACRRGYGSATVLQAHTTGRKHRKGTEEMVRAGVVDSPQTRVQSATEDLLVGYERGRSTAESEWRVRSWMEMLGGIREDTRGHVERKQALTDKERMIDTEEATAIDLTAPAEEAEGAESDDPDREIYNPLNLPLGWDGKPIPFWLYKLHGLGVEYPCEICGGYVYMGRKAFEKHFSEGRHSHGMKSLGIPNSRYFQDITSIPDAYALAEKLKTSAKSQAVTADVIEEFEDEEGNVLTRKTYEDLKRQGLI